MYVMFYHVLVLYCKLHGSLWKIFPELFPLAVNLPVSSHTAPGSFKKIGRSSSQAGSQFKIN